MPHVSKLTLCSITLSNHFGQPLRVRELDFSHAYLTTPEAWQSTFDLQTIVRLTLRCGTEDRKLTLELVLALTGACPNLRLAKIYGAPLSRGDQAILTILRGFQKLQGFAIEWEHCIVQHPSRTDLAIAILQGLADIQSNALEQIRLCMRAVCGTLHTEDIRLFQVVRDFLHKQPQVRKLDIIWPCPDIVSWHELDHTSRGGLRLTDLQIVNFLEYVATWFQEAEKLRSSTFVRFDFTSKHWSTFNSASRRVTLLSEESLDSDLSEAGDSFRLLKQKELELVERYPLCKAFQTWASIALKI